MSEHRARVCVLIATLGEAELLEASLTEVRRQADALGAEVLLVVNAEEASLPLARRGVWEGLAHRVLFEPRSGKSHALNTGLGATEAEIVAFGDDDAMPFSGWLERLTAPLRQGVPGVAGCGGRVVPVYPTGGAPAWYRHLVAGKRSSFLGPLHDLGPEERDYPGGGNTSVLPFGANCAYLRAALMPEGYDARLGPSRRTGLRGGEDTVVALRVQARGGVLRYVPDAVVHHPVTPERLRPDFVLRGYYLQGVEAVRFLRITGRLTRSAGHAARRLWRHRVRGLLRRAMGSPRAAHHRFRQAFYRGYLDELARPLEEA